MAKKLEQLTGNEDNNMKEGVAQIYIGTESNNEFYQLAINNIVGDLVYFNDISKKTQDFLGITLDEIRELREALLFPGLAVYRLIKAGKIKRYDIKNGSYFDKKNKTLITVEKVDSEIEVELINIIHHGLIKS